MFREFTNQFGNFDGDSRNHFEAGNVDDKRIPSRALLCREDPLDRRDIESVSCQSIAGLSGNCYHSATLENRATFSNGRMIAENELVRTHLIAECLHARQG